VDTEFGQAFYYMRVAILPPISYSVDVEKLDASDVAATDITTPNSTVENPVILVPSHERVGSALDVVKKKWLVGSQLHAIAAILGHVARDCNWRNQSRDISSGRRRNDPVRPRG